MIGEPALTGEVSLRAAKFFGELADIEPIHLELQRAERNAEVPRRGGDVPAGFLERAQDEVALEGVGRLLEEALAAADATRSSCAKWNSNGRSSSVIHSLSLTATSRSIRFSSSRMLPGHQ